MSDEKEKPLTIPEVIWATARWIAKRELLVRLGVMIFLIVVGAAGVVYAQDAGVKLIAPLEARVTKLEQNQLDMQRMTLETNATVKMIAREMGIKPLSLAPEKDGGQ